MLKSLEVSWWYIYSTSWNTHTCDVMFICHNDKRIEINCPWTGRWLSKMQKTRELVSIIHTSWKAHVKQFMLSFFRHTRCCLSPILHRNIQIWCHSFVFTYQSIINTCFPKHFITIPKTHTQICTNGSGKIVLACKFNDHQHFYRHRNLFR